MLNLNHSFSRKNGKSIVVCPSTLLAKLIIFYMREKIRGKWGTAKEERQAIIFYFDGCVSVCCCCKAIRVLLVWTP